MEKGNHNKLDHLAMTNEAYVIELEGVKENSNGVDPFNTCNQTTSDIVKEDIDDVVSSDIDNVKERGKKNGSCDDDNISEDYDIKYNFNRKYKQSAYVW